MTTPEECANRTMIVAREKRLIAERIRSRDPAQCAAFHVEADQLEAAAQHLRRLALLEAEPIDMSMEQENRCLRERIRELEKW